MLALRTSLKWNANAPWLVFTAEWLCVVLMVLVDIQLAPLVHLDFRVTRHDGNLIALPLLGAAILSRKFGGARGGLLLEFFALMLAAAPALSAVTYICAAAAGPLRDAWFLSADRAIGFDWLQWFHFVMAHRIIAVVLNFLYVSVNFQAVYFCVLLGMMGNARRLHEIFWLMYLALALTALGSWLAPALGPFQTFGLRSYGYYLPEMERLRSGAALSFSISEIKGVVTFPSFHTTMALAMIYAFRRTGPIGWIVAAANLVMLLGIPVFGGHYLMDMFAGAFVFVAALVSVRLAPALLKRPARAKELVAA